MTEACNLIAVIGPTASGKTSLAAHLASRMNGEVISADSRQVYRHMNLGTGKDYDDYIVNGVPCSVIICWILPNRDINTVFSNISVISFKHLPISIAGVKCLFYAVVQECILMPQ